MTYKVLTIIKIYDQKDICTQNLLLDFSTRNIYSYINYTCIYIKKIKKNTFFAHFWKVIDIDQNVLKMLSR